MISKTPAGPPIEQAAIQDLLAIAREKFAADLHVDVSVFDQSAWDVRRLRDRSTTSANPTLYFTRMGLWISRCRAYTATL